MSLEAAIGEMTMALERNSDLLEQNLKSRGDALAAASALADKPAPRGRGRKPAEPPAEEPRRETRDDDRGSRSRDRGDDRGRGGDDDRGSRSRDREDDRGSRTREKEDAPPRGRGRPAGSSKKNGEISDDDLRAAFGGFMDVEDEKTREDRKDFVLDMFDVLKVDTSIEIDQRDRADAIRWLDEELDGKFKKFKKFN